MSITVNLAYGRDGLPVNLPAHCQVVQAPFVQGVTDEPAAILTALRQPINSAPLASKVRAGNKVVIVHTDITRATPNDRLLPVLLAELEAAGIARGDITLLNALGTHRPQTAAELREMLGAEVVANYRCLQHDANDTGNLVSLGVTSRGHPVRINRQFLESDVRILTGFIEPHFFAGFSGGPKGVLPSIAGAESVHSNHGYAMISDPNATWGVTAGNPVWEEMREVALRANPTFLINVTLNSARQITGIFAGDMLAAHAAGCKFVKEHAMVPVAEPFDIVITTNSGYPLDQNLYQCVKGLSAASRIVRAGGTIILAAACADGLPEGSRFAELLEEAGSPQAALAMLEQPGFSQPDQWQVQIQAKIQLHADVYVHSAGLTDAQIQRALLRPCQDIAKTITGIESKLGRPATICVLPEGPQTIAYVR
ncbi:MAG: nickel-dependent lactate racemase [Verrucomicrobiota bacterium]|jgi:lactate racemase